MKLNAAIKIATYEVKQVQHLDKYFYFFISLPPSRITLVALGAQPLIVRFIRKRATVDKTKNELYYYIQMHELNNRFRSFKS